jgi:hypothetical protein
MREWSERKARKFPGTRGCGLLIASLLFAFGCGFGSRVAEGLTLERLLSLRCGMTEGEVSALLGVPLIVEQASRVPQDGSAARSSSYRWIYATPGFLGGGLEVSVGFTAEGRVSGAGAEEHDLGLWLCRPERCPWVLNEDRLRALLR